MVADHAEEDPATAVVDHLGEDHIEVAGCVGIAEGVVVDRTVGGAGCSSGEHSWDDSFEVPKAGVEGAAEDHFEVDLAVGDHAAEDDDCSATESLHNRPVDHHEGQDLADQELEGLCKGRGCGDRMELVGLDLEEDPAVVGLVADLDHAVDHCNRLYVDRAKGNESHHVHLDCHLYRLEEHPRRVEVAAHIRTEDAAAGRNSLEEVQEEEVVVEENCMVPTCLVVGGRLCDSARRS